jgi:hypothetical protein
LTFIVKDSLCLLQKEFDQLLAFAGTILGALYAFRTRSPAPIGVTAHSAIVLGLMGGQFVGKLFDYFI